MGWTKEDKSFKKLISKRASSAGFKFYEEFGDSTLDLQFDDIKTDSIPFNDPTQAVNNAVAEVFSVGSEFILIEDTDASSNKNTWFTGIAASGGAGNGDYSPGSDYDQIPFWISDKNGDDYSIHLYQNDGTEIFLTDPSNWIFDYTTGILTFGIGDDDGVLDGGFNLAWAVPLKITGYRYIGDFGGSTGGTGGGGVSIVDISQVGIGLLASVGDLIALQDTGVYALADATDDEKVAVGITIEISNDDNIKIQDQGIADYPSGGLIKGYTYYLDNVAGGNTHAYPADYVQPVFVAIETDTILVNIEPMFVYETENTVTYPEYRIRVSSIHGDDGTGAMGDYTLPFQTINAAAVAARAEIVSVPSLAGKIVVYVEQGDYVAEEDIMFDGTIVCEFNVVITTSANPLLLTPHDGVEFKLTGLPDLIDGGGSLWDDNTGLVAKSIYIEANSIIKTIDGDLRAEELELHVRTFDLRNSVQFRTFSVNNLISVINYISPGETTFNYIAATLSTMAHVLNVKVMYMDGQTSPYDLWGFGIDGFNDLYDTKSSVHVTNGDYDNITMTGYRDLFYVVDFSANTSSNLVNFSSEGITVPTIISNSHSKDITVLGMYNCTNVALEQVDFITVKNLSVTSINNDYFAESSIAADIDVIGSLTMETTQIPKVEATVTLTYISDLPGSSGGGSGGNNIITVGQTNIGNEFVLGDIISLVDNTYVKANATDDLQVAIGVVVEIITVDALSYQDSGDVDYTKAVLTKGQTYYLDATDGNVTPTEPNNYVQPLFVAIETNKILINIDSMIAYEGTIGNQLYAELADKDRADQETNDLGNLTGAVDFDMYKSNMEGVLTGNITSVSFSNLPSATNRTTFILVVTQDGIGGKTINWIGSGVYPSLAITNAELQPNTTGNSKTQYWFYWDGTLSITMVKIDAPL